MTDKPVKITVVSHSGEIGGAELALIDMLDFLSNQTPIIPNFVLPWDRGGLDLILKERGWEYVVVPYTLWAHSKPLKKSEDIYRENRNNILAVKAIVGVIDKMRPQIVLSNSIVCPWGAIAASQRPMHHIWYVHEYGDAGLNLEFEMGREKTLYDVGWFSEVVISNSNTIKHHLSKFIDKSKVHAAYCPVDLEKIKSLSSRPAAAIFSETNYLKIILVGRIVSTKGQIDAVKAVGMLKKQGIRVELCLVGTTKDEPKYVRSIKQAISDCDISDRVKFLGYIPNPLPLMKQADIGLTCSHNEGFGRTTLEYLTQGKAVIGATDTGATKELVRDGVNGFAYNFGDFNSLADRIANYEKDRALLKTHSTNSYQVLKDIIDGPNSPKHLVKIIQDLARIKPNQKLPNLTERIINFSETAEAFRLKSIRKSYLEGQTSVQLTVEPKPASKIAKIANKFRK